MRANGPPVDHEQWLAWRRSKLRRDELIETFVTVVVSQVLLVALLVQFYRGHFSDWSFSRTGVKVVVGLIVGEAIALFVAPTSTTRCIGAALRAVGSRVIDVFTSVALGVVYLLLLPFGATIGRRSFVRRHHASAPWVQRNRDWRHGAWVPKPADDRRADESGRSALWRLLGYFIAQRTWFLLIVTIVVLVVVSVSVFSHTSQLAPFVYTLF
jgi:uncharacterized membrane protein YdfJ with MMPL/SSD domain